MRWNKINVFLMSALGAVSCVPAAANVAQSISDMDNLAAKIGNAQKSLDNYNGARENLADSDNMISEEGSSYAKSYEHMYPVLLDAIHSARGKAPLINKSGLGPEARTYLSNLHGEKRLLEDQAKAKVPDDIFLKIKPSADQITTAFDEADAAFK
ncbi:hypothetical protein PENANT_c001G02423 [Penicillium antarcticum]|uniref:Uncharacterized protein n=1 Tax=Penicillium antarcticum TaxID=416450 RepID=A0A1V6QP03_9EURO|nr:uncharacterized protein N7508_010160 [Penicillium antarcticum]KAJ5295339.1 hypothetical protein N7508_010160 [Penicillium antarcticum]OQD90970.1 hypothetical protein PENANT_c001G02423 [Penicillium antarcticum]